MKNMDYIVSTEDGDLLIEKIQNILQMILLIN